MKLFNNGVGALLTIGMYFSCFIIASSFFQIPKEIDLHGEIPLRIILMLGFSFTILTLTIYFSEEPEWKTITKLLSYILAFCTVGVTAFGIRDLTSYLFNDPTKLPIMWASLLTISGMLITLVIGKCINSKWLN